MLDFPDEDVAVAGVLGPLSLDDALFQARKSARLAPLQVVRADRVAGPAHVRSAALHARRALAQGRAHGKTRETEFMRYLAGERQVRAALDKMGLPDAGIRGGEAAALVAFGSKRVDALRHFIEALGLREDDDVLAASDAKLDAFGVTAAQRAATTPGRYHEIVLEAVAAVDLMRS